MTAPDASSRASPTGTRAARRYTRPSCCGLHRASASTLGLMRRISCALAGALLTALACAGPALARDATVTSFDGTKLTAHFFPSAGGGVAPTVMLGPGWGSPGATDENQADGTTSGYTGVGTLRNAGYNVLTWDPRGFGTSEGTVEVDSPDFEGRDAQALIDFIAAQPEAQLDAP